MGGHCSITSACAYNCSIPSANIVPSGHIWPNPQTGRQQMGRPICQHFAQSADILSNQQTGRRQMGQSHLATFWPLCRNFVQSAYWTKCSQMGHPVCGQNIMLADGPSHLLTGPSGYISPNLQMGRQQMGHPICQHFAQSADILSNLHTGQNVPRCALPSAICRQDASPDGPEHNQRCTCIRIVVHVLLSVEVQVHIRVSDHPLQIVPESYHECKASHGCCNIYIRA